MENFWNNLQNIFILFVTVIFAHSAGIYQVESKYKQIEKEDTQRTAFIETFELKKQNVQLKEKVQEKEEEIKVKKIETTPSQIVSVKKYYLLLKQSDDSYLLRTGGTPSWRYNNPGKLLYGNFAKSNGAIGNDGPLAIFPNYDAGKDAFETFLFESDFGPKNLSIDGMIKSIALTKDGYNQRDYVSYILKANKSFRATTKLSSMTSDEKTDLIEAIQEYENWTAGNIRKFENFKQFEKEGY